MTFFQGRLDSGITEVPSNLVFYDSYCTQSFSVETDRETPWGGHASQNLNMNTLTPPHYSEWLTASTERCFSWDWVQMNHWFHSHSRGVCQLAAPCSSWFIILPDPTSLRTWPLSSSASAEALRNSDHFCSYSAPWASLHMQTNISDGKLVFM